MKKILSSVFIFLLFFTGCKESKDEPKPVDKDPITIDQEAKQVTLVYAVNYKNGLENSLVLNEGQIIDALKRIEGEEDIIYLFKTFSNSNGELVQGLFRAVSGKNAEFKLEKEFKRDLLSTDPRRLNEIIGEVLKQKGKKYNLFLWGHGMAWTPYFSSHDVTRGVDTRSLDIDYGNVPEVTAFGGENSVDWMDIEELKEAIPDHTFETIWFDCCYMSNIETVYELRDKCRWMVAYPTEIAADGLPYNEILPCVLKDEPDLKGGVQALFNYYDAQRIAVTGAVMDMSQISGVASACQAIYSSGEKRPDSYGLQNYSRSSANPYYDFGQYVREYAQANDSESLFENYETALNRFVVFSVASDKDFNWKPIVKENFSGISTHLFKDSHSQKDDYYKTLDWYKATYISSY